MKRGKEVFMASKQSNEMTAFFTSIMQRVLSQSDIKIMRDILEGMHLAAAEPEDVTYAEVNEGGVRALWCIPKKCKDDRVLLYGHGGGTVFFSMHTDRKAAGHLAKAAGVRALIVDFGLSPENKFPAQNQDIERAYRWLLVQGFRPEHIVATGQSVGGNLAVSLAINLRNKGEALPAAILAVCPWFDTELKNKTIETNAKTDKVLSRPVLELFRTSWLDGTAIAWNDPRVNMLYADLRGLPPIQVYYGEHEVFAGESIEFATRAEAAGVETSLRSLPEGQHNFVWGAGRVPEVDQAVQEMGQWLRSKLGL
jgi:acetyl esterase/lipase